MKRLLLIATFLIIIAITSIQAEDYPWLDYKAVYRLFDIVVLSKNKPEKTLCLEDDYYGTCQLWIEIGDRKYPLTFFQDGPMLSSFGVCNYSVSPRKDKVAITYDNYSDSNAVGISMCSVGVLDINSLEYKFVDGCIVDAPDYVNYQHMTAYNPQWDAKGESVSYVFWKDIFAKKDKENGIETDKSLSKISNINLSVYAFIPQEVARFVVSEFNKPERIARFGNIRIVNIGHDYDIGTKSDQYLFEVYANSDLAPHRDRDNLVIIVIVKNGKCYLKKAYWEMITM